MSEPTPDAAGSLTRFVAGALVREGAIVEPLVGGLNVALPPALAVTLDVREFERLVFNTDDASLDARARLVDYDAPLVEKLAERLALHGSIASAERRGPAPKTIDAAQTLADGLTVQNGIARVVKAEIGVATYVGVVIQYDVLADERMSGIVSAWASPDTRSVPDGLSQVWEEISAQHADERGVSGPRSNATRGSADSPHEGGAGQDATPSSVDAADLTSSVTMAWPIVQAVSTSAVRASLGPFLASLTRRRDRDLDRVHQYYREIHDELARKASRHHGEARAREEARLHATVRAWEARVEEVAARYRTRVTLTPVTALVCRMPAWHVHVRLQRRTAVRDVTWLCDGRGRTIEPRACDHCNVPTLSAYLCDDRVHYLCRECFAPCDVCGKSFCRACVARCPKTHPSQDQRLRQQVERSQ